MTEESKVPVTPVLNEQVATYGRMIKFSHSIFAMPFALASFFLATRGAGLEAETLLWVVVAMVGARSAAMGFNRLVDADIDARNPRTASREIPAGKLSKRQVLVFILVSSAALVLAAWRLNPLCLALSPLALGIVFGYSYTKRFTMLSHFALGLSLAIAPVGAWIAVSGTLAWTPLAMATAVLFWVAGFDILYSCQDAEFDRREALHSIPAKLGIPWALGLARAAHVVAIVYLLIVAAVEPLHWVYFVGLGLIAALFVYEHSLVRADDLSKIDAAFFTVNGWIGVLYLLTTVTASVLR